MTRQRQSPYLAVKGNLGQLTRSELQEVAYIVAGLLQALEDEDQPEDQVEGGEVETKAARGHIELKIINGCGPYRYLRYWAGKTLKSHYLGKAKES